jgi:hypothetical protein
MTASNRSLTAQVERAGSIEILMIPSEVSSLLYELCVDLGFCLPPEEQSRLRSQPPTTIDAFTDAVFRAEGMDPLVHPQLRKQVRHCVAKHFRTASDPDRWLAWE